MIWTSSRSGAESGDRASRWTMLTTPLRGVRISWLMLARNWLLETLALSAVSRPCSMSRSFWASWFEAAIASTTNSRPATPIWAVSQGGWPAISTEAVTAQKQPMWGRMEAQVRCREPAQAITPFTMAPAITRMAAITERSWPPKACRTAKAPKTRLLRAMKPTARHAQTVEGVQSSDFRDTRKPQNSSAWRIE